MHRWRGATGLAAVAALGALAHAESRPRYSGSVEAALPGAPVALDPIAAQTSADITVVGLVFDTLYTIDADGTVQPHLAVGPPVFDASRTVAHVAIRHGVMFHDAAPLMPADVADSLERARTRAGWVLAPVASVKATVDGVDLTLRAPADLAMLLALPQTAVTRRGQPPVGSRAIGSGPFAVDSFDPGSRRLSLKAFDDHFAGRPYVDHLTLTWFDTPDGEVRRFETGLAQLSARGMAAFAGAKPKYPASEVESPPALLAFVGFGASHPAITSERGFRRAFDLALDRGALASITTGERTLPTRLPLPPAAGGAVLDALTGDAALARNELAAAARRAPALADALRTTKLAIIVDETRPDDREIALRVSRALDKLGVGFTIEAVAANLLRDRAQRGDCDLWIGQLAAPVTAAEPWWGAAFAAGNDGWAQAQLAAGTLDGKEAAKQFAARLPIVPLMFRSLLIWHRADLHGLAFDASARPRLADLYWPKGKP
jgi:peptide/nickel transport system substrate-binding protein